MAKILSKTGITTGNTVRAFHVTQSVDAFTGTDAYDITISGSLVLTGSQITTQNVSGSTLQASTQVITPFIKNPLGEIIITPGNNSLTVNNNITASGRIRAIGDIISLANITASAIIGANEYRVDGQRVMKVDTTTTPHSLAIYPSSTPALSLGGGSGIILNSDVTGSSRTISGSNFIGEVTNVYRPVLTASANPFTASNATAGGYYRAGGNITCSIFVTESVSCTIGSEFEFFQTSSTGNVLFETGSGVTLNSKSGNLKLTGQFSAVTLKYVGNNEWDLIGDLS